LFAYGIFQVIYGPRKAFKEIVQNPRYMGPILIIILFTAVNATFFYTLASKTYDEQTLPSGSQKDEWTESSSWWTSNANVSESNDALSGGYYGNKSIEFSVVNDKQIWMQLNFTEPVDCSGSDGYKNMSFRTKLIYPNTTELANASVSLFSSQVEYFRYNLTEYVVSSDNNTWNNLTVGVGLDSGWEKIGNADWSTITNLKFDFTWAENTNSTVRLDGLFFRGVFKSLIVKGVTANYIVGSSLTAIMQFVVEWVLIGGLIFLMARAFGAKTAWRPLFIVVGSVLITSLVLAVINVAAAVALPTMYRRLELIGGVGGESEIAYNRLLEEMSLASRISAYGQIAVTLWTIILLAIAIRSLTERSWTLSILVALVTYFVALIAMGYIFGA
jgi:hypothetical protein